MDVFGKLPFVLDGATGTRLQEMGMPGGVSPEMWCLENPEVIREIQRGYVEAGSNAVYAPTFSANRTLIKKYGIDMSVRELCRRLVEISRSAVDGRALVGGDMAPSGLLVPPMGETTFDELVDIFTEQAEALEEAGVDFFGIETQTSLAEARACVTAVRAVSDKPVLVSFSCGDTGRTLMGGSLTAALLALQDMGVYAFGVNCCGKPALVADLLDEMKPYASITLIAKPNAGIPRVEDGRTFYPLEPEELAKYIPEYIAAGAGFVGGCCGTGNEHIAAICRALGAVDLSLPGGGIKEATAASEFRVTTLSDETEFAEIEISDNLMEDALEAELEGANIIKVCLRDESDIQLLWENQYSIRLPLCFEWDDSELLSRALRIYSGKPLIL